MTVSTHSQAALAAGGSKDNNGGVIAGAGTVSGNDRQITSKSVLDLQKGIQDSGSRMTTISGTTHNPGIQAALASGGSFAFTPARASRSKTDTGFIMNYVPSLLAGKAATSDWLAYPSSDYGRKLGNIHPKTKTYQKGTWATQVFDIFGGGLLQSDGTAKAGITNRGTASNYKNIRGSGNIDDSAQPAGGARAIPGEFIILHNFVDYDGASTSGDGTGSENMMDYSAITG